MLGSEELKVVVFLSIDKEWVEQMIQKGYPISAIRARVAFLLLDNRYDDLSEIISSVDKLVSYYPDCFFNKV